PLAAATRGLAGVELAELAMMKAAGARGVATGRRWIGNSGVMLRVMACAEAIAIARDVALARVTGARLHVRLVTTAAGFDLIRAAKAEGLSVTCGVSPAYLFLNDVAVSDFRTFARLSPPLRSEADRLA